MGSGFGKNDADLRISDPPPCIKVVDIVNKISYQVQTAVQHCSGFLHFVTSALEHQDLGMDSVPINNQHVYQFGTISVSCVNEAFKMI